MPSLPDFMREIAGRAQPEPRTEGHDLVTAQMAPDVAKLLKKSAKILDVGCGNGPALEWFTKAGFKDVRGISLNEEDVDICLAAGYDAKVGDMNDLSLYYDGYFDCVWARHALEHSVAPLWTLTEFHRVLKSNTSHVTRHRSLLYVEVPAPDTACRHESNPTHYSVMGHRMWLNLIHRAGFEVIESKELNLDTAAGKDTYWSFLCRKNKK